MARLCIYLLGPCYATLDRQPVAFEYDKVRALLAYLVVEGRQPIRREHLAAFLWPEGDQQASHNGLRQALSRLRQAVGDREAAPPVIHIQRDALEFNFDGDVWVDVLVFHQTLEDCTNHRHRNLATCPTCARLQAEACQLYRGNFLDQLLLPDSAEFEAWAVLKREQLRFEALEALRRLAAYHERLGDYALARGYAERQLQLDPLSEEAHRQMLRALASSGQRGLAIRHYNSLYRLIVSELGAEPAPETAALYESIRAGVDHSRAEVALVRWPVLLTPLVGREAELSELDAWLADPARRLITIAGPGGIGKTHLALAAAERQMATFPDGVVLVPLAEAGLARGDGALVTAIAQALRLTYGDQPFPEERLADALRGRQALLVLDSWEHVLAGRAILGRLMAGAPGVVVLATSRERLNMPGEWVFELGGLECPPMAGVDEIEIYSAVRLFVQSARHVRPSFRLLPEDRPAVAAICQLVSGMPLALGLAAAWVRLLSCREIAGEIQQSLDLLSASQTAPHDTNERLSSMRAIFDQSWRRLTGAEQRVFRQLSVFRGGCDRAAAVAVVDASLEVLMGLVDKTFVQGTQAGRYDCHELLKQFGAEKLVEAGEDETLRARHYAYFLERAETNERLLQLGPSLFADYADKFAAMFWLIREQANLQAALAWATQGEPPRDPAGAERLRQAMHQNWHRYGVHLMEP